MKSVRPLGETVHLVLFATATLGTVWLTLASAFLSGPGYVTVSFGPSTPPSPALWERTAWHTLWYGLTVASVVALVAVAWMRRHALRHGAVERPATWRSAISPAYLAGFGLGFYATGLSPQTWYGGVFTSAFVWGPFCVLACLGRGAVRALVLAIVLHVGVEVGAQLGWSLDGTRLGWRMRVTEDHLSFVRCTPAYLLGGALLLAGLRRVGLIGPDVTPSEPPPRRSRRFLREAWRRTWADARERRARRRPERRAS